MKKIVLSVSAVALALVLGVTAVSAQAVTTTTTTTSTAVFTRDLTIGSTGADVSALQAMLIAGGKLSVAAPTGYFGAMTKAALASWQASVGIMPASGYFGPVTRAYLATHSTTSTSTSTVPGCVAGAMYSATTGQPCSTTTSSSSSLNGGAGDLSSTKTITSGTETTLGEGKEEKVLGMELEADDNSDLAITSFRVQANLDNNGSTRLNRYIDEAIVYMGDKKVGSLDVDAFSRDTADYTGTIALKNAVIKKGDKERFYVAFVGKDAIESLDQDNTIEVYVDRIRFEDATGAILTDDSLSGDSVTVDFEDATEEDGAKVQSSSATPDSSILKVEDNSKSDDYHIFTFKIKTDSNSADIDITSLPINLEITNGSGSTINTADLIDDIWVEVDGQTYDDSDEGDNATIAGNATEDVVYTFDIDEGDLTINGDDTVDAKVYVKFGEQDGNYAASGNKITASVVGADIEAENANGDVIDMTGSVTGKEHSVSISSATVNGFRWAVDSTGAFIDFYFTVEADDEDFDVLTSSIASSTSGTATTSAGVLSFSSGDDVSTISGGYTVASGDTATFRVRYTVTGANGTYADVRITSVAGQEVSDDKEVSPTAVRDVQ